MKINVDFNEVVGKIKPLHGVGNAPFVGANKDMFHYLSEAGVPFSRLHDTGGAYGRNIFVDVPNIFRDENADVNDENSYDFAFTDWLLENLEKQGVKPFYRLGVTIENYWYIKAYRIYPPKDYEKWAKICEHIIRHYNEGWANGYHMDIKYWEIWNEPENGIPFESNQMWLGTNEEYFRLYEITSKHLKNEFPNIKIGGYAGCGFYGLEAERYEGRELAQQMHRLNFFDEFLVYVKEHECPLDYFSWHSYESVNITIKYARYVREKLDFYGFKDTESIVDEWDMNSPWNTEHEMVDLSSAKMAADTMAMMCSFQKEAVDAAMSYQSSYGVGMFNVWIEPVTKKPYKNYYAYVMFNELYKLGNEVKCEVELPNDCKVIAAANDGKGKVIATNPTEKDFVVELNKKPSAIYIIDKENDYDKTNVMNITFNKYIKIKAETVMLLEYDF